MLRRNHRFFQSLQVMRDVVLVALAFYLAFLVRFSFPDSFPYETISEQRETAAVFLMLVSVWPALAWASGLYLSRRARSVAAEAFDVSRVTVIAFLLLVTVTYFVRDVRYSRATLILWAGFTTVIVSAARVISRVVLRRMRARGYNLRHVLVVGSSELAQRLIETIHRQGSLGLRVLGLVTSDEERHLVGRRMFGTKVMGTVSEISSLLAHRNVDQVLVALPIDKLGALKGLMAVLSQETVDVRLVPDFYQYMTLCGSIEEFAGLPIINLQATPLMGWNLVTKRMFDLAVAGFGLVLCSPLLGLLALLVKWSSPGPVFFTQERVGMDGRLFKMYKLRTMAVDAERDGARMTTADDPRRTPVGALLRRLSLDEVPQLLNVFIGDMSLVGPRPEQPRFIEDFKREIPRYALRHKIKAGMTGWAQVNGMRGNTSIAKRIEFDLYYIENWSLLLDIKILVRTVFGGFLSPNAY